MGHAAADARLGPWRPRHPMHCTWHMCRHLWEHNNGRRASATLAQPLRDSRSKQVGGSRRNWRLTHFFTHVPEFAHVVEAATPSATIRCRPAPRKDPAFAPDSSVSRHAVIRWALRRSTSSTGALSLVSADVDAQVDGAVGIPLARVVGAALVAAAPAPVDGQRTRWRICRLDRRRRWRIFRTLRHGLSAIQSAIQSTQVVPACPSGGGGGERRLTGRGNRSAPHAAHESPTRYPIHRRFPLGVKRQPHQSTTGNHCVWACPSAVQKMGARTARIAHCLRVCARTGADVIAPPGAFNDRRFCGVRARGHGDVAPLPPFGDALAVRPTLADPVCPAVAHAVGVARRRVGPHRGRGRGAVPRTAWAQAVPQGFVLAD